MSRIIEYLLICDKIDCLDDWLTALSNQKLLIDINKISNGFLPIYKTLRLDCSDKTKKKIITTLLKHGADINTNGGDLRPSPLTKAIKKKQSSNIIRFLIQNNADCLDLLSSSPPMKAILYHSDTDTLDIFFAEQPENKNSFIKFMLSSSRFDLVHFYEMQGIKLDEGFIPLIQDLYDSYQLWKQKNFKCLNIQLATSCL